MKTWRPETTRLAALAVLTIALRLFNLAQGGLWYDELQSVTHSILPVRDLLASVQTFDPHPPLYYLQLHGWLWFGQSDFWIRLNSVVWSVLAALSLYLTSRVIFTVRVARWAALTFALSPLAIGEAQEARMYALLMFLGIWGWFFTHHCWRGATKSGWSAD